MYTTGSLVIIVNPFKEKYPYSFPIQLSVLCNKYRSLSRVLHCDKPRREFENTSEM